VIEVMRPATIGGVVVGQVEEGSHEGE
jgi:hypothetical protein